MKYRKAVQATTGNVSLYVHIPFCENQRLASYLDALHAEIAQAATSGRLHRNFQGFTDDDAPVLIGLSASAISSFPTLLAQNEKNSGRYRMLLSQERLTVMAGKALSVEDRRRGAVIKELLCLGERELLEGCADRLAPISSSASGRRGTPVFRQGLARLAAGQARDFAG